MAMLTVCRGLPGCGKTYWTRWQLDVAAYHGLRGFVVRSNRDCLRTMMVDMDYIPGSHIGVEDAVTAQQHAGITALLRNGIDVICDDTNLYVDHVERLRDTAQQAGAGLRIENFTHVSLEMCIERDAVRTGRTKVGAAKIRAMYERHMAPHGGVLPDIEGVRP